MGKTTKHLIAAAVAVLIGGSAFAPQAHADGLFNSNALSFITNSFSTGSASSAANSSTSSSLSPYGGLGSSAYSALGSSAGSTGGGDMFRQLMDSSWDSARTGAEQQALTRLTSADSAADTIISAARGDWSSAMSSLFSSGGGGSSLFDMASSFLSGGFSLGNFSLDSLSSSFSSLTDLSSLTDSFALDMDIFSGDFSSMLSLDSLGSLGNLSNLASSYTGININNLQSTYTSVMNAGGDFSTLIDNPSLATATQAYGSVNSLAGSIAY